MDSVWPQADMNAYFHELPAYVQENMLQTGVKFSTVAEMRAVAERMMGIDSPNM